MQKTKRIVGHITEGVNYLAMVCLVFVVVIIFVDVVIRLVTSKSILGTYEMTEEAMIVIIYCAVARTQMKKGHVHVTILTEKLPRLPSQLLQLVMSAFSVVVGAVLTSATFQQGLTFMRDGTYTAVLKIPTFPFAFIMSFGLALFTVALIIDTADYIVGLANPGDAKEKSALPEQAE